MQSLGKAMSSRRMPPPANLPSLAKSSGILSSSASQSEPPSSSSHSNMVSSSMPNASISQQSSLDSVSTPTSSTPNQPTIAAVVSGGMSSFAASSWPAPSAATTTAPLQSNQNKNYNKMFGQTGVQMDPSQNNPANHNQRLSESGDLKDSNAKWGQNVLSQRLFLF